MDYTTLAVATLALFGTVTNTVMNRRSRQEKSASVTRDITESGTALIDRMERRIGSLEGRLDQAESAIRECHEDKAAMLRLLVKAGIDPYGES